MRTIPESCHNFEYSWRSVSKKEHKTLVLGGQWQQQQAQNGSMALTYFRNYVHLIRAAISCQLWQGKDTSHDLGLNT
jgi:hypothetical protein